MKNKDFLIAKNYTNSFILKDNPDLVLLTGSRALGYAKIKSDYDICVIGRYNKKNLMQSTHDFTQITKYPKIYQHKFFEIEHESFKNIIKYNQNLLDFKFWKFQNCTVLYSNEKYNISQFKKIEHDLFSKTRVWLCYHSIDLLYNFSDKIDKQFKILWSANALLKLVFLCNNKPVPIDKWRIMEYKKLKWRPKNLLKDIQLGIKNIDAGPVIYQHKIIFDYIKKNNLIPIIEVNYINDSIKKYEI